ncbi:hypothetical protein RN001_012632 [Aquatica leii]|uniref:BRCT domain-containing protein n=1 Tax=Aquatica leii TaxID=1421715 RepID=A0AAN7SPK4_9COLE|nr:hypothetical protein RN001_012632 [Aquatica leii]
MNINSNVSNCLDELNDLDKYVSCSQCNEFKLTLRRLSNCTHLLCESCFMLCGTCSVCGKKHISKNLQKEDDLTSILSHLDVIREVNNTLQEVEDSKVTFLFAYDTFNYKRHHNGETRLHKECRSGNFKEVESLVRSGMDVNVQDFAGWTPLHEAVLNQRVNIVKFLLANGAFVNVPGLDYLTPLHSAIQERNEEIIKALVQHGADCSAYNKDGKTALDLCEDSNIRNLICLTPCLPSIVRTYTVPEPKIFLHNVDKNIVKQFSMKTNLTLMKKHNLFNFGDVKFFVIGNNLDVKYLQAAMLQGACVVTLDFVNDLILQNVTINPMNYFAKIPEYATSKAGLNALNKFPKLFDGIHFYFANYKQQKIGDVVYSLSDVKTLILLGGGKIDARSPSTSNIDLYYPYHTNKMSTCASTSYYILYDESNKNFKKKSYTKEIKYQTIKWLTDCINNFTILP